MRGTGFGLIAPLLVLMVVAFNLPIVYMLGLAFWEKGRGFTLEHYEGLIETPVYLRVLGNTLRISLIATAANDWLGRMFMDMCAKYAISLHGRKVNQSSLSFIMPKDGKRAIVRARDDEDLHPYPHLYLRSCRAPVGSRRIRERRSAASSCFSQ